MIWVNFHCWGVLLIWIIVGQGPTGPCSMCGWVLIGHFFSCLSFLSSFFLSVGDGLIYRIVLKNWDRIK